MPLISCRNVTLRRGAEYFVDELNMDISTGDFLCVTGGSGSGKSTFIEILLGTAKPASGKVIYGDGMKKEDAGFLPQSSAYGKDNPRSVRDIVLSGCMNRHTFSAVYTGRDRRDAIAAMKKLGIEELADRSFRELSGGQRQRVMLARSICAASRLLVLDEPFTGLDFEATRELYNTIEKLNKEDKITIIVIAQNPSTVLLCATHVLVLDREYCFFGTRDEYMSMYL